jgi:hypothetical protein
MPALKNEVQRFIVQSLACFMSPTEVVGAVKNEFKLEIDRQQVRHYNPLQNTKVAKKWQELFYATREQYIKDVSTHGIAHQSYRLDHLNRILSKAQERGHFALAAQVIEQAAKELGGFYAARANGSGGGDSQAVTTALKAIIDYYSKVYPLDPANDTSTSSSTSSSS